MTLMMMFTMSIAVTMMFILHPVTFIFTMIIYTGAIAVMMSAYMETFWYGYTLILIFLGGMLILFLYIASIAPNEKFPKMQKSKILFSIIMVSIIMLMYKQESLLVSFYEDMPITLSITKLYYQNMFITMFLVMYLLITLLIVVKITNFRMGPLRSSYDK